MVDAATAATFTDEAPTRSCDADYLFNLGYAYLLARIARAIYWVREALRRDSADPDAQSLAAALRNPAAEWKRPQRSCAAAVVRYENSTPGCADICPVPKCLERVRLEAMRHAAASRLAIVNSKARATLACDVSIWIADAAVRREPQRGDGGAPAHVYLSRTNRRPPAHRAIHLRAAVSGSREALKISNGAWYSAAARTCSRTRIQAPEHRRARTICSARGARPALPSETCWENHIKTTMLRRLVAGMTM